MAAPVSHEPSADSSVPVPALGGPAINITATGDTITRTVPFSFVLTGDHPNMNLDLRGLTPIVNWFAAFETVELLSAEFTMFTEPGSAIRVYYGISADSQGNSRHNVLACPIRGMVGGLESGVVTTTFALPTRHPWGRLVRGTNLGNPFPRFHWHTTGATGAQASVTVSCDITLRGRGQGIFIAIELTPTNAAATAVAVGHTNYSVAPELDESDEE